MTHFYPGQFVECINADPDGVPQPAWVVGCSNDMDGLQRGKIYTVRALTVFKDMDMVLLVEIERDFRMYPWGEYGFNPLRFRPVDERRLDVFRAMLEPKRRHEHV